MSGIGLSSSCSPLYWLHFHIKFTSRKYLFSVILHQVLDRMALSLAWLRSYAILVARRMNGVLQLASPTQTARTKITRGWGSPREKSEASYQKRKDWMLGGQKARCPLQGLHLITDEIGITVPTFPTSQGLVGLKARKGSSEIIESHVDTKGVKI